MIKPEISFERFLNILLPGVIIVVGTWYLHRPFLMQYFPTIAADSTIVTQGGATAGIKTLIFLIAATCAGLIINLLSDIAIVAVFDDDSETGKAKRKICAVVRFIFQIFTFGRAPDPRTKIIFRYLNSSRKDWFLKMIKEWTKIDENKLQNPYEAIVVHQHILTRLQTLSAHSKSIIQELFSSVIGTASIFISFCLLFPISVLSLATTQFVRNTIHGHPQSVLIILSVSVYVFCIIFAYALKRRFTHFCSQIITYALHFYSNTISNEIQING